MSMIECSVCDNKATTKLSTKFVNLGKCRIVIDNVPCFICTTCEEVMYYDDVAMQIEKIVGLLKNDFDVLIHADYQKFLSAKIA